MPATMNIRYGGQILSVPEDFNFSPQNYGTARLKIKVNSSSTRELGLTTNTNAQEYSKLKVRVNGQIAYLGRVSSTSYTSGEQIDYNGSSIGSRSQTVITESLTRNSNSGSGTSAADPTIRTITNNTGSSVTSATASEGIATKTSYSLRSSYYYDKYTISVTRKYGLPAVGNDAVITYSQTQVITSRRYMEKSYISINANSKVLQSAYTSMSSNTFQSTSKGLVKGTSVSTTRWISSSKKRARIAQTITTNCSYSTTYSSKFNSSNSSYETDYYSSSGSTTVYSQYTYAKCYTTSSISYYSKYVTSSEISKRILDPVAEYYLSSTRWSYSWTSCEKYTNSTTNVSETLHNMNI